MFILCVVWRGLRNVRDRPIIKPTNSNQTKILSSGYLYCSLLATFWVFLTSWCIFSKKPNDTFKKIPILCFVQLALFLALKYLGTICTAAAPAS